MKYLPQRYSRLWCCNYFGVIVKAKATQTPGNNCFIQTGMKSDQGSKYPVEYTKHIEWQT